VVLDVYCCLQAIVRLVQSDDAKQHSPVVLSHAERHQKHVEFIKCLIQEHPQLVAEAARNVGWELTQKSNPAVPV